MKPDRNINGAGKRKKKARHTLTGVYPAVRKYSYLRRYGSLRKRTHRYEA